MELRPAAAADLPPLAAGLARLPLLVRYGRGAARLEADLAAALARGDGLLLAAEGGRPAGLAWFLREGTLGMGGYLKLMAVLPEAQARGTGAALLAAFEAEVAAASAHAFLLCSDFNAQAQRFYERHGWARAGALPALVLPDVAELVYWKRVRP
jgi:GNAT superfamily N-acetyltransferase